MGWYNSSWTYRQKITMSAALIDEVFQVLPIAGSELGADFFDDAQTDGDDIRFTAADGTTELACHILFHDAGTDTGRYFVDVSSVSNISTDVDIYVYYGNSGASAYSASATYGADAVWDSHAGVYFPGMSLLDFTNQASGRALTAVGSPTTVASGYEGITAAEYDGTTQYHEYSGTQAQTTWPVTLEALLNADTTTVGQDVVAYRRTSNTNGQALLRISSGNQIQGIFFGTGGSTSVAATSNTLADDTWGHAVVTRSGTTGTSTSQLNGNTQGTSSTTILAHSMTQFSIGASNGNGTPSDFFDGRVAAVMVTSSVRSSSYAITMYNAWSNSGFISASAQETGGNIGTGAITLGAATVSGTGTEREDGSGTPTLGNVEVSGDGTQSITGAGAITLAATSVSGTGVESLTGSAQIDLGPTSVSGSATYATIGSGAIVLAPVVVEGGQAGSGGNTGWFLFSDASTELLSESVDGVDWSDPEFALTEFSDYAISAYTDVAESSRYLVIKTPVGISIPSGVSISSIQYRISKGVSYDELPADRISDLYVRPIKGGVIVGDNIAQAGAWSITDEVVDYGGDLLGETWESADFDENFGLAIAVDYDGGSPMSARIKTVWGKITYESIEPIEGSGAITLGGISVESPATLIGSGSIVLGNVEVKAAGNSDFCNCCIGYTMSTLLEIRKRLARESGHYELVADYDSGDYADNGMDEYIRGGARYLDDKFQYDKSEAWFYKKLVEGESLVTFQNNRIIKSVWVNQASGDRKKLKRLTLDEIREQYTKDTLAGETNGIPSYWTPAILGLAPEQYTEDAASFVLEGLTDYDLIMFGNHYPHKGIYVMPPCDDTYTVEVLAEWYSAELCDDEDVSFWSQYPEILCMAARREIEIHLHRNTTGAAGFERPIIEKLLDLYRNLIAEEVSGPPEDLVMNG